MSFKASLLAEVAWVLVEAAMMLAAAFGSPNEADSQLDHGGAIGIATTER